MANYFEKRDRFQQEREKYYRERTNTRLKYAALISIGISIIREFGIRNTIKKLNRQLEKVADSFGNITDI